LVESVPNTGIKLPHARPETEPALGRQLDILRRLELLRRSADPAVAGSTGSIPSLDHSHLPALPLLKDLPAFGSGPADTHFLQDVAPVGQTGIGETVYLALSAVVEPSRWKGGWGLALVPPDESERFQAYLADAREAIVAQLQHRAEVQP